MRLLLVEDDRGSAGFLRAGLEAERYQLEVASDGLQGLEMGLRGAYDLILLSAMLPDKNGMEILREWRDKDIKSPIMMLSELDSSEDAVKSLELGADDFVRKPVAFEELLARIRALLRRGADLQLDPTLRVADLTLDPNTHEVRRAGTLIELTPKEFSLLSYLMRRQGRVLSRAVLEEQVWGRRHHAITNVVHVYIRRLRDKMDRTYTPKLIHTIRGIGYQLKP